MGTVTCPDGSQPLSPLQIYQLLELEDQRRGTNNLAGKVKFTAIIYRESGGCPKAYRPASKNPAGGNDRGILQFNSKYFPDIPDSVAFDPATAIAAAYDVSKGFVDTRPWDGKPIEPEQRKVAVLAANEYMKQQGGTGFSPNSKSAGIGVDGSGWEVIWDTIVTNIDPNTNPVTGPVIGGAKEFLSWTDALKALLENLLSGDWWRRIGIGVLGIAVVVVGLILMFGKDTVDAVGSVKPI